MGTWCKARSETAETRESVTRHVQDRSTRPRQPRDETSQHGNMTRRATRQVKQDTATWQVERHDNMTSQATWQHDKSSDTTTWQVERRGNMTSRVTRQHDKSSDTATWLDHMTLRLTIKWHYAIMKDIMPYKGHYALQRTLCLTKDISLTKDITPYKGH